MRRRLALSMVLALASAGSTQEVQMLWERIGIDGQITFGAASYRIGDLDGDGYEDWLHPAGIRVGGISRPEIHYLSGRDGSTIRTASTGGFFPGPAGDWDGDGLRDYYKGSAAGMNIFSSRDDSAIVTIPVPAQAPSGFGAYVLADLDVDGDGQLDLVVGARISRLVWVFSHSGQLLYTVDTVLGSYWRLGNLYGDMDDDGADDFMVAVLGDVHVYSGRTGALITVARGEIGAGLGIGDVVGCGDVNADGIPDFAASSNGSSAPGLVQVFAGTQAPTAHPLYTWTLGPGIRQGFGQTLEPGDMDQDGLGDLLVGSGEESGNSGGKIHWYDLRTGRRVLSMLPLGPSFRSTLFGINITVGAPHPDHPYPVFIAGDNYGFSPVTGALGRVALYRAGPASIQGLGPGCAGTAGSAPRFGLTPWAKDTTRIHLSDAPPGTPALLALGSSSANWGGLALPWSLAPLALPGCSLRTSIDAVVGVVTGTHGKQKGHAFVDLPLSVARGEVQVTVHGQWLLLDQGGTGLTAVSDAMTWGH